MEGIAKQVGELTVMSHDAAVAGVPAFAQWMAPGDLVLYHPSGHMVIVRAADRAELATLLRRSGLAARDELGDVDQEELDGDGDLGADYGSLI